MQKEDFDYFRSMAQYYGENLEELYRIVKNTDWINIGTKPKKSVEKMFVILNDYKKKVIKENKEIKTCYKNNLALLDKEETNTTKLVNKVMKLEKIISDIKKIAQSYEDTHNQECKQLCCTEILEKLNQL